MFKVKNYLSFLSHAHIYYSRWSRMPFDLMKQMKCKLMLSHGTSTPQYLHKRSTVPLRLSREL